MAGLHHDLRMPLNAIVAWAEIAAASPNENDAAREAVSRTQANAHAQSLLINDVLDLVKSGNEGLRVDRTPVDLADVVASALAVVEPTAAAKRIQGEFRSARGPVVVPGDSLRLQRVVWNLLTNALKFTPRRGRVTVDLKRRGSVALLRVADTACGIASELLPRIFDRFEQGNCSSDGIGLGLPIVRRLVDAHGGTVFAESAGPVTGAAFAVSLPLPERQR
jgi:signal transduction histidine kinase